MEYFLSMRGAAAFLLLGLFSLWLARTLKIRRPGMPSWVALVLAFILLFCVGLGIAMNALNNWLVRFEASQPTAQCQAVFGELFAKPDWELIHALSNAPEDISAEAYARYMEKKVGNTPLTYIETSAGLSGDKK